MTSVSPRRLRFKLIRSGGAIGSISVRFTVQFHVEGVQQPVDGILTEDPDALVAKFVDSQREILVELPIKDAAFLGVKVEEKDHHAFVFIIDLLLFNICFSFCFG